MDDYEKRIALALGTNEVPEVDKEHLDKYKEYILARIDKATILTGREDFQWEEKYIFGYGDIAEYKRLKKNQPSYEDDYKIIDIFCDDSEENDLIAKVVRLSDKKRFVIGLSWLTTKDEKSKDLQLLDDFAKWAVNW